METIPTHKIRLLLSIIQLCFNKIISPFSSLNLIPVFSPTSENSIWFYTVDQRRLDWSKRYCSTLRLKNCYNLMETIPTNKIRLLLSIIQIISQFSSLNLIPVFNPTSKKSIWFYKVDQRRLDCSKRYCSTLRLKNSESKLHKKQKARNHDKV